MTETATTPLRIEHLLAEAESIFPGRSSGSYAVPSWMQDVVITSG